MACPCSGVPLLERPAFVGEVAHDDATVSFLLSQALLAREVEELEARVAVREQSLMVLVEELRGRADLPGQLSRLENATISWVSLKWEGRRGGRSASLALPPSGAVHVRGVPRVCHVRGFPGAAFLRFGVAKHMVDRSIAYL